MKSEDIEDIKDINPWYICVGKNIWGRGRTVKEAVKSCKTQGSTPKFLVYAVLNNNDDVGLPHCEEVFGNITRYGEDSFSFLVGKFKRITFAE